MTECDVSFNPNGFVISSEIAAAQSGATIKICGEPLITPEITDEKLQRWQAAIDRCRGSCKEASGCSTTAFLGSISTMSESEGAQ